MIGIDGPAAGEQREVPRGRGAQLQDPGIGWVVRLALLDRRDARLGGYARRVEIGLAHGEVDDVLPGGGPALRLLLDRDRLGGLEIGQVARPLERHQRTTPWRRSTSSVASSGSASAVPR